MWLGIDAAGQQRCQVSSEEHGVGSGDSTSTGGGHHLGGIRFAKVSSTSGGIEPGWQQLQDVDHRARRPLAAASLALEAALVELKESGLAGVSS